MVFLKPQTIKLIFVHQENSTWHEIW